MAAILGHRSPSPLTASKSSNSSSFHSSSVTSNDEAFSETMHFEEIGLEDENVAWKSEQCPAGFRRELTAPASASDALGRQPSYAPRGDFWIANRPILSNPFPKRGLSSLSASSLAIRAQSHKNGPRSLSPLRQAASSSLPGSMSNGASNPGTMKTFPMRPSAESRRLSSQRGRKSIKELEDEYDDLDEHLPDDASLWNVPISPRPLMGRSPASPGGFFDKQIIPSSPNTVIEGAATPRQDSRGRSLKAPVSPIRPPFVKSPEIMRELSRSNKKSMELSQKSKGLSESPNGHTCSYPSLPKSRAKSWGVAMSELSEEARALTGVLESYAISAENGSFPGLSKSPERPNRIVRPRTIDLPPLNTGNIMIDPLPISKEKERFLSRTRPSWLPPKSRAEEKRHLREYQQMMERSQRSGMKSQLCL